MRTGCGALTLSLCLWACRSLPAPRQADASWVHALSDDLRESRRFRDRVALWEDYGRRHPDSVEAWDGLAWACYDAEDYSRAAECFERSGNGRMLAHTLLELGRAEEALRLLGPGSAPLELESRAAVLAELGRFDEARAAAERLTAHRPLAGRLLRMRIEALAGDFAAALEHLQAAEALPGNAREAAEVAEGYYDLELFEETRRWYETAVDLDLRRTEVGAALGLIRAHSNLLRFDEAVALAGVTLKAFPGNPFATALKANLLRRRGSMDEARALIDRAVEDHPQDLWLRMQRAWIVHVPRGDYEAAVEEMARARTESPNPDFEAAMFGWALQLAGRHEEAAGVFERLLARNARTSVYALSKRLNHDFDFLNLYLALRQAGRHDEAHARLAAQRMTPPGSDWARSVLYCVAGDLDPEELISRAHAGPALPVSFTRRCEGWFWVGVRLHFEGKKVDARRAMQACVEAGAVHFVEHDYALAYLAGRWMSR